MTNTEELKQSMEKIQQDIRDRQRRLRDRPAKGMIWTGWIAAGLAFAAGLAIIMWILGKPEQVHMRETINPLVLCIGVAGVLVAAAGHVLLYLRRGQDEQRTDWEDVTSGLNLPALGRLAAQLQAIELVLPSMRAAIELNREVTLRRLGEIDTQRQADARRMADAVLHKMDENERQRQSDFDAIRELSAKRLGEFHDQLDGLGEDLDQLTEMVKARDDELAARLKATAVALGENLERARQSIAAEVAEVVSKAQGEAFAAGIRTVYEEIASVIAEGERSPGVEQPQEGGVVIPLPSSETMEALRRLARKMAQPEDNFEDRTG